jgi:hypothetical protein
MTRTQVNRIAGILPLVFSALAFGIVVANVLARVPPAPDENASAHLWQLLMAAQVPLLLLFAVTADWRKRSTRFLIMAQLFAIGLACFPVWLAGY